MNIEIVKQTIKEMVNDRESTLTIKIFINDLLRSNDITNNDYYEIIRDWGEYEKNKRNDVHKFIKQYYN
jgi:hypothetical protein